MTRNAVLLVNLGTPDSPAPADVRRYLHEFLTDPRVIDIPWLPRQLLVRGRIVPKRLRESSRSYQAIWTERGSPLMMYGEAVRLQLQQLLGNDYQVQLGMRYQHPSIAEALARLQQGNIERLVVVPLFPQYASATTGSVHEKVMKLIQKWQVIPEVRMIHAYPTQPQMIEAFAARGRQYNLDRCDRILFSFHGLPQRQLIKADRSGRCMRASHCCQDVCSQNRSCYAAQCYATARAIMTSLQVSPEKCRVCFQSRLGKDPWIEPYTSDVISACAAQGDKRLVVFCPAFVCDCLETLYEIGVEYKEQFVAEGGESLQLVEGLNDDPKWVEALASLVT